MAEQMGRLAHTASDVVSEAAVELSRRLHQISGRMGAYSITLCTGAEAVEFCMRFAKHMTGRTGVICFDKGYHGLTLGAQSITYTGRFVSPPVADIYPVPIPSVSSPPGDNERIMAEMEEIVRLHGDGISCMIFEPLVSVGGMIIPPDDFFHKARELCDRYGIVLIFDESQTGFGRLGEWFAYQALDVVPDMVAVAKGLGNGYPVSAALFAKKMIQRYPFTMTHYSSHQNDPFAAGVVNAAIRYIEGHHILKDVRDRGRRFLGYLKELEERCRYLAGARGRGLMLGIDLEIPGVEDHRPVYARLRAEMMRQGVIIQGTNGGRTLRFLPDYLLADDDMRDALEKLDSVLTRIGDALERG